MNNYVTMEEVRKHILTNAKKDHILSKKIMEIFLKNYSTLYLGHLQEEKILFEKDMINIFLLKHKINLLE